MTKYFGTMQFYKRALLIAVPVMLQQLIQTLVSLVDSFMVSGLGDVKMSGVNIAGQILFVFMIFVNTVCTSGGIFMTQFSGAKDKDGMQQSLRFKIIASCMAMALFFAVCLIFPRQVLSLMVIGNNQAEEILDVAEEYIRLMSIIGIPMMISTIIASSLREIGRVKPPLVISIAATLINTFFNWVLIYGNLGAPRLEIRGAAYATIIARIVEMILFVGYIVIRRQPFMFRLSTIWKVDFSLFRQILRKGTLVLFSEMLWVVSETVTSALYNQRGGAEVVSGMASSFAIANLYFVAIGGMNMATAVIIGHTLGEGRLEEARQQKNWMLSASVVFGLLMTGMGMLTTFLVPVVFGNLSAGAQKICKDMVLMMSFFMPCWVYVNTQFSIARSGGDTKMGAVTDGIFTLAIAMPGIFLLALFTTVGPVMMYFFVKIVDIPKVIFAHFWLKKGRWIKNLTAQET